MIEISTEFEGHLKAKMLRDIIRLVEKSFIIQNMKYVHTNLKHQMMTDRVYMRLLCFTKEGNVTS